MSFNEYHCLFELLISFNFAYAGLDSFSKSILTYVYINKTKVSGLSQDLEQAKADIDGKFEIYNLAGVNNSAIDNIKSESEVDYQKIRTRINNLINSDPNQVKEEIYKSYDKHKFKSTFLISGFYLIFQFIIISFNHSTHFCTSTQLLFWYFTISNFAIFSAFIIICRNRYHNKQKDRHDMFIRSGITFAVITIFFVFFNRICIEKSTLKIVSNREYNIYATSLEFLWLLLLLSFTSIPFWYEYKSVRKFIIEGGLVEDIKKNITKLKTSPSEKIRSITPDTSGQSAPSNTKLVNS